MYENNLITETEYKEARIDESEFYNHPVYIKETPTSNDYPMKYFIEYVIKDVRDRIMVLKGWEGDEGRRKAEQYIYSVVYIYILPWTLRFSRRLKNQFTTTRICPSSRILPISSVNKV